jgi:light-regulated signal transduction histidine kinase (bacteriophytochrome)
MAPSIRTITPRRNFDVQSAEFRVQSHSKSSEDPKALLHKLNNQLGVILAHAELLETKAQDAAQKARASQVVNAALQAMAVSRELRETVGK